MKLLGLFIGRRLSAVLKETASRGGGGGGRRGSKGKKKILFWEKRGK
jgi:hypothetical protein